MAKSRLPLAPTAKKAAWDAKENGIPRQATAPVAPIEGALWLDISLTPFALKLYRGGVWENLRGVSSFFDLAEVVPADFTGAAGKIVAANAAGTGIVFMDFVAIDGIPSTEKTKLADAVNWTGESYTGPAITGTFQGQRAFLTIGTVRYRVEMEEDNLPFRTAG